MIDFFISLIKIIHIGTSILLVIAVLIQSGKGGGLGTLGGSAATTVFGGSGGADFMVKFTSILGAVFILTSGSLAYLATKGYENRLAKKFARKKAKKVLKKAKKLTEEQKQLKENADKIIKKLKNKKKLPKQEQEMLRKTNELSLLLTTLQGSLNQIKTEAMAAKESGDTETAVKAEKSLKELEKQQNQIKKTLDKFLKNLGLNKVDSKKSTTKPSTQKGSTTKPLKK